jgi:fatty acid desaturase
MQEIPSKSTATAEEARALLRRRVLLLGRIEVVRSLGAMASIGCVIAAAFALVAWHQSVWTFAIAFLLIASRQHALLILVHECWHGLFLPDRALNHLIGQVVGYSVGSKYWLARDGHLDHHRNLGRQDDPDRPLHSSSDKATRAALVRYFGARLLGGQLLVSHQVGRQRPKGSSSPSAAAEWLWLIVVQLIVWGLLALFTGRWWTYPLLWALPIATATTLLNSLRAFTEHAVPPDREASEPSRYFSITASPLERFFLAPLNFNCHAEHHLYPTVPYHRLPLVRRLILADPKALPGYSQRSGYLKFIASYYRSLPA